MVQIYATLGPACAAQNVLEKMFQAGMTGIRLNLSHTGLKESAGLLENFHKAAKAAGVKPQLLIDMQGPELRLGKMETIELKNGETVILGASSQKGAIPVPKQVILAIETGDEVLLNDGKVSLSVREKAETYVETIVTRGGVVSSHKSVKITGKQVEMPVLTEHDLSNIRLAAEYGVTGLMQPFVKSGQDLKFVRQLLKENGAEQVQIFAKIVRKIVKL